MSNIDDTFDCMIVDGVVQGHCVVVLDNHIIYAGPIRQSPKDNARALILLHKDDMEKLRAIVNKGRH